MKSVFPLILLGAGAWFLAKPKKVDSVNYILNNSFGMLGINSSLIIKKYNK